MHNVLMIICDQLSATALKIYGNTYGKTPNIDAIAEKGIVFENAYTTCPLCQPARASLWTSKYPHQTNVLSNLPDQGFDSVSESLATLGEVFASYGYDCQHFGKKHDYGSLRGFECHEQIEIQMDRDVEAINYAYETYLDENTTRQVEAYFKDYDGEKPFITIADLQNPHNICMYIGENEHGHSFGPVGGTLPELPANFECEENRPEFIKYLCCAHRRQSQVTQWTEEDYQYYLYAYHYYIQLVDKQIGRIMTALEEANQKDDTLIIFTSDHGEGMAGHKLVTKYGAFYEETNRVPMIFSGTGITDQRRIKGLTSLLDIMPTLLECCGLDRVGGLEGISQYDSINGESECSGREYICGEWYDEFSGYRVPGRMIRDNDCKYIIYKDRDGIAEELYDMNSDRLEQKNLIGRSDAEGIRRKLRAKLEAHLRSTKDSFWTIEPEVGGQYRNHLEGFSHHKGSNAVLKYAESIRNK